jgi:O-antigen/teichoic acid export membrane protein
MKSLRARWSSLFSAQGFRGPVLTLLSGSTAMLALGYLTRPVFTRLYSDEAFGLMEFIVATVGLLIPVASLRYEDAVMLPDDEQDAAGVLGLATGLTLLAALLCTGLALQGDALARFFDEPALAPLLWLVPPLLLLMKLNRFGELWLTRTRRFRAITAGQVTNNGAMIAARMGAALPPFSPSAAALVGSMVLGHLLQAAWYGYTLARTTRSAWQGLLDSSRWRPLARRYRRFALFSMPSTLLHALVTRLPALLLLYYFDRSTLGQYGQAFNALFLPLSLTGTAIAQVFFVQAAEAHRAGTLPLLTRTVHARLVMLGLFPTLLLMLAGPDLFAFVFGAPWRPAGQYVQYIAPWLMFSALAAPLTRLFDVLERQRLDLLTSMVMFAGIGTALVTGGERGDLHHTLLLLGLVGSGVRLLHLGVLLRLGRVPLRGVLAAYGRYAAFSLPVLLPVALVLPLALPWLTALMAALAGVGYAGLVLWQDRLLEPAPQPPAAPMPLSPDDAV